jgi:hypothetical protein
LGTPICLVPPTFNNGDKCARSGKVTLTPWGFNSTTLNFASTSTITTVSSIKTPAGTFNAIKVLLTLRVYGSIDGEAFDETGTSTTWFAEDVGMIADLSTDPVETTSLKSYFIDIDGDGQFAGYPTIEDNCPLIPNPGQADFDGDTLGDACDGDDDGDGMSDYFEERYALNPLDVSDASLELDGDGLVNIDEFRYHTNPRAADTDGDGVNDDVEIALGTSPDFDPRNIGLILDAYVTD